MAKRFLDCFLPPAAKARVLICRALEYLTKPKVSPASSESRDDCGDAETLLGFLF